MCVSWCCACGVEVWQGCCVDLAWRLGEECGTRAEIAPRTEAEIAPQTEWRWPPVRRTPPARISSLRRKAGRRVACNEPRDVKRRRAATGLARARLRAHTEQFLGVGVPSAVAWRMARALRGWGQSRRWAWEHAMILPSALGDQAKGRADGYLARAERVREAPLWTRVSF